MGFSGCGAFIFWVFLRGPNNGLISIFWPFLRLRYCQLDHSALHDSGKTLKAAKLFSSALAPFFFLRVPLVLAMECYLRSLATRSATCFTKNAKATAHTIFACCLVPLALEQLLRSNRAHSSIHLTPIVFAGMT